MDRQPAAASGDGEPSAPAALALDDAFCTSLAATALMPLLTLDERARLAATCRRFRAAAEAPALWRELNFADVKCAVSAATLAALCRRAAAHGGLEVLCVLPPAARTPRRGRYECFAGLGRCLANRCRGFSEFTSGACDRFAGRGLLEALRDGVGARLRCLRAGEAHALTQGDALALAAACPLLEEGEAVLLLPCAAESPLPRLLTQRIADPAAALRDPRRREQTLCVGSQKAALLSHFPANRTYCSGETAMQSLARSALDAPEAAAALQELHLRGSNLHNPEDGQALVATLYRSFSSLRSLDLGGNQLRDCNSCWRALGAMAQLRALDVSNNPLGPCGAAALADGLLQRTDGAGGSADAPPLLALEANRTDLGDRGVAELARAMRLLSALSVRNNYVGDLGSAALTAALVAATPAPLEALGLADNRIRAGAVSELAAALAAGAAPQLRRLDLHGNVARDEGAAALAAALRSGQLPQLLRLALGANMVGAAGADALADARMLCPALTVLDLHANPATTSAPAATPAADLPSLPPPDAAPAADAVAEAEVEQGDAAALNEAAV